MLVLPTLTICPIFTPSPSLLVPSCTDLAWGPLLWGWGLSQIPPPLPLQTAQWRRWHRYTHLRAEDTQVQVGGSSPGSPCQGLAGSLRVQRRIRRQRNKSSRSCPGDLEASIPGSSVMCSIVSVAQGEQKEMEQGTSGVIDWHWTRMGTVPKSIDKRRGHSVRRRF